MPDVPNYVKKIEKLLAQGVIPTKEAVCEVFVFHDDSCSAFKSDAASCNCDPDIGYKGKILMIREEG